MGYRTDLRMMVISNMTVLANALVNGSNKAPITLEEIDALVHDTYDRAARCARDMNKNPTKEDCNE